MITARNTEVEGASKRPGHRDRGLPLAQFGLFATCLLAWALGLMAFCISCLVAILSMLAYSTLGHHSVDFAVAYRYVAFPIGLSVMVVSFLVLLALWFRRKFRNI